MQTERTLEFIQKLIVFRRFKGVFDVKLMQNDNAIDMKFRQNDRLDLNS